MQATRALAIQRTVVLTIDDEGVQAGEHLRAMLEAWGDPPVVAVRQVDPASSTAMDEVDDALKEVSRLSHRITLQNMGFRLQRLDELHLWVVGACAANVRALVSAARHRAEQVLGAEALTMGIHLSTAPPEDTAGAGEAPGADRSKVAGCNGPWYTVGLLNEDGLSLDDPKALYRRTARFIALHTCTALRDLPVWLDQGRVADAAARGAAFGLVWLAWPGDAAHARGVRMLKRRLLPWILGKPQAHDAFTARAEDALPAPSRLGDRLIPDRITEAVSEVALDSEVPSLLEVIAPRDQSPHPLLARWDERADAWTDLLNAREPEWRCLLEAVTADVGAEVDGRWRQTLDEAGIIPAQQMQEALLRVLREWTAESEARGADVEEDVCKLEAFLAESRDDLEGQLGRMPRWRLRDLIGLVLSPVRMFRFWRAWRHLKRSYRRYLDLQAAAFETRVAARRVRQVMALLYTVMDAMQSAHDAVSKLEEAVREVLDASEETQSWPDDTLLVPEDADALVGTLFEQEMPALPLFGGRLFERWGARSTWLDDGCPARDDLDVWLAAQVAWLREVPLADVVDARFDDPRARMAWLREMILQAAPFRRWDPTSLSDRERAEVRRMTLCLSADPDVEAWLADDRQGVRILPLDRADALGIVTVRWGIPPAHDTSPPASEGQMLNANPEGARLGFVK